MLTVNNRDIESQSEALINVDSLRAILTYFHSDILK